MNYDVLEESMNSINNLEDNAWANHKEEYINVKGKVEELKDQREAEELAIKEATTKEEVDNAQDELTKIIDETQTINDDFNASLMEVDDTNPMMSVTEDTFQIDTAAINSFLNNMNE